MIQAECIKLRVENNYTNLNSFEKLVFGNLVSVGQFVSVRRTLVFVNVPLSKNFS